MIAADNITTLTALLELRARDTPDRVAFDFDGTPCSYGQLWNRICDVAVHLMALGVQPGDHVAVVIPNGGEFFPAFYGVMRAGAVAVPLFPGFSAERILAIADLCGAKVILVPGATPEAQLKSFSIAAAMRDRVVATVAQAARQPGPVRFPEIRPDDIAFVQYTSGSTGAPKGVQISHDNLLTNIRQMIAGMQITSDDIFVSWLPLYHDMGLILKTMVPFYLGLDLYLLPTDLQDVTRWLKTIATRRATFTAAPDFAYRLCVRRVANPEAYDLSSLRVALNAAEPVRASTIRDFERAFGLSNVMVAAYGLAEATVGVSMWPPNTPAKVDDHGNVSAGKPFPDVSVVILRDGAPAPVGEVGEIAVKSTALPRGYLNSPKATASLFWAPDTVLSGDLGYIDADGDLFIVGRKKNTIIQTGRNLHPQEIEAVVDQDPDIRYSIAVGIDRGHMEGEQVYIFAEVQNAGEKTRDDFQNIVIRIVQAVNRELGFRPRRVYLVKAKTIPMTYNGKFQHRLAKRLFLEGDLKENILFPDY